MMKEKIRNELKGGSTIDEVCNKYNLTFKELLKVFKSDFHSYSKPRTPKKKRKSSTGVKYVYMRGNVKRYWIQKGGEYYGHYKTLSDAVAVRNGLILNDWNKDELDTICQKLGIEREVKP